MNYIVANPKSERDQIDFFVTVGDNIYPSKETENNPTDKELDKMMSLFSRP
jgi:phosphodiesterase/alkaline phosphatase D-like protein